MLKEQRAVAHHNNLLGYPVMSLWTCGEGHHGVFFCSRAEIVVDDDP